MLPLIPFYDSSYKLRQVLSPFIPAVAHAKIQREEGQPIQIIKQAGTKG